MVSLVLVVSYFKPVLTCPFLQENCYIGQYPTSCFPWPGLHRNCILLLGQRKKATCDENLAFHENWWSSRCLVYQGLICNYNSHVDVVSSLATSSLALDSRSGKTWRTQQPTLVPRLAAQFANDADAPSFLDCANAPPKDWRIWNDWNHLGIFGI